jgi:hypothetical protein
VNRNTATSRAAAGLQGDSSRNSVADPISLESAPLLGCCGVAVLVQDMSLAIRLRL